MPTGSPSLSTGERRVAATDGAGLASATLDGQVNSGPQLNASKDLRAPPRDHSSDQGDCALPRSETLP